MSDLDLLHQLEEITGKKLKEEPEEKFKLDLNNTLAMNFVEDYAYALSQDGDVIALFLRNNIPSRPFPFYDFEQLKYLYLIEVDLFSFFHLERIKNLQTLALVGNKISTRKNYG